MGKSLRAGVPDLLDDVAGLFSSETIDNRV